MRNLHEMQALIHAYRDFSECVLETLQWSAFGTTLELAFDYIWRTDGTVRPDDQPRLIVTLRLDLVQELYVQNRLRPGITADPEAISWGLAEVSRVVVSDDERSAAYRNHQVPFYLLSLRREDGPWIEVIFSELSISESMANPASGGGTFP